ncbi:MAG: 2OG-Fe(II) oxygenase [Pseudomonadota bacterium]
MGGVPARQATAMPLETSRRRCVTASHNPPDARQASSGRSNPTRDIEARVAALDQETISDGLHVHGHALVADFLSAQTCHELVDLFDRPDIYRKTVSMARHRFGLGEYKYWSYPLPVPVSAMRAGLYPLLAPIANQWMHRLGEEHRYPETLSELRAECVRAGQSEPTPLILKYGAGGHNTLHQDLYGEIFFPIQAAVFLTQPHDDFTGGEFVLTEQVPRAQAKATVLQPQRGDLLLFTTNFRPVRGRRGFYRAKMRHGVSEVRSGHRYTLGIIFHDAES